MLHLRDFLTSSDSSIQRRRRQTKNKNLKSKIASPTIAVDTLAFPSRFFYKRTS